MDSSWSLSTRIAKHVTHEDVSKAAESDLGTFNSPVLKIKADAAQLYDTVCLPLTTPAWRNRWREMCTLRPSEEQERDKTTELRAEKWRAAPGFDRHEVTMSRLDEGENVTGIVSEWLELDSADDGVRHDSEIALKQELAYATYLNIQNVILPPPRDREHVAFYGRAVRSCLETSPYIQLSIHLPIYDPAIFITNSPGLNPETSAPPSPTIQVTPERGRARRTVAARAPEGELSGTWEMWDIIRSMCDYNPRLTITLDLTPPLPHTLGILGRWNAEPVQAVFLPASTFIPNAKGYPVLPKAMQSFLQSIMKKYPTVIMSGADQRMHPRGFEDKYVDYVRYVEKSSLHVQRAKEQNTLENYSQGYQDFLQMPLQPLQDHLASAVYENFERDPVKYIKYEEAIFQALSDLPGEQRIVICVAGAGRGPLIARSLRAVQRTDREVFIYAIEKNPNAYVTWVFSYSFPVTQDAAEAAARLMHRQEAEWRSSVKVIFGDMRVIDVPEKADILVSELLGSFGDNELSPECLDGAMRFLKEDGISIPSSYTAHLAPISSSKLYQEAGGNKDPKEKEKQRGLETPYVVMIQAANILSDNDSGSGGRCGPQIQECWEFEHPRKDVVVDDTTELPVTNSHNTRSATLTFHIPHAGVLNGFGGYFEAVLYGNVGLSIHPHRQDRISKDMLSWFPCYFPLKEALYLPCNSELKVSMWRLTGNHKVWYEWYAESFLPVSGVAEESRAATHLINSAGSLVAPPATPTAAPSPMIDAIDARPAFSWERQHIAQMATEESIIGQKEPGGLLKIGQTSLHNPGGRSSWYGL